MNYSLVNASAVNVTWNYQFDDIDGFVITVMNDSVHQVNDTVTNYHVLNGLQAEKKYFIEVRGYSSLIGAPGLISFNLSSIVTVLVRGISDVFRWYIKV